MTPGIRPFALSVALSAAACAAEAPCVDAQGYESGGGGALELTVNGQAYKACNAVLLSSGDSSEVVATATRDGGRASEESWAVSVATNVDHSGGEITCTELTEAGGCLLSWATFAQLDTTCSAYATTWDDSSQGPLGSVELRIDSSQGGVVGSFSGVLEALDGCDGPVELSGNFDVP
ncbi:MAG: hypothetical protein H6741_03030 [Alphaproteobacteria bacterium]|nr:hypothetical protein [Alphaproteobacteria bacterium]